MTAVSEETEPVEDVSITDVDILQDVEDRISDLQAEIDDAQRVLDEAIERAKGLYDTHLAEILPEHNKLLNARAALKGEAVAKPRAKSIGGGRGRPKGSGKRADEVLKLLAVGPKTIRELSEELDIQPNYLYRVVPQLAEDGKVVKGSDGAWSLAS